MNVNSAVSVATAGRYRKQIVKLVFTAWAALAVVAALGLGLGQPGSAHAAQVRVAAASRAPLAGLPAFSRLSCKGRSFCMAIGSYSKPGKPNLRVLEEWNGKTWRIIPEPAGFLYGITCGGPSFCLGDRQPPKGGLVTVVWNGRTWQNFKYQPPDPYSVSCETPTFCVTFGSGVDIVEWNGGKGWHSMPGATDGCAGPDCTFDGGLSCWSATNCVTSGSYCDDDDCDSTSTFSETWNGTAWIQTTGFLPFFGPESCTGHSFCMVLATPAKAAISRDLENTWHSASAGLAAACRRAGNCGPFVNLSCGSPWSCLALPASSSTVALTWSGARWTTVPVARISDRLPKLTLLSCGARRDCVAIGSYRPTPRSSLRLISEYFNGSKWQVAGMPNP